MALLHFSNLAPSAPKGKLLSVLHDDHGLSPKMNMKKFITSSGSSETWPYTFSTVFITDKTKEDLDYLLEEIILFNNSTVRKYTFTEPAKDTEHYSILKSTGEIYLTFAEFEQYIMVNNNG